MRKKISFKGIIIGAVTDVVGTNIWGLIAGIYLAAKYQVYLLPHAEQTSRMYVLLGEKGKRGQPPLFQD